MEPAKVYRDESTPDRKEIWTFVERAAARSSDSHRITEEQSAQERERAGASAKK